MPQENRNSGERILGEGTVKKGGINVKPTTPPPPPPKGQAQPSSTNQNAGGSGEASSSTGEKSEK
jgi:hypothetical protein